MGGKGAEHNNNDTNNNMRREKEKIGVNKKRGESEEEQVSGVGKIPKNIRHTEKTFLKRVRMKKWAWPCL